MVAHKRNKSSQGQEDVMPDDPLKEAVVGLWYDASVPKPNIKVVFIQMTLIFFADRLQHPYGIPLLRAMPELPGPRVQVRSGSGFRQTWLQ